MLRLLRNVAKFVLSPVMRAALRLFRDEDPWEPLDPQRIAHHRFGQGSIRPFDWYLEGESTVTASTIDDIAGWLLECEYASDESVFNESDFWQHPRTFELLRRGDCEDHALWAWRKLRDIGVASELIVGRWQQAEHKGSHAWIVFELDGERWLFETVSKSRDSMIIRLDEAKQSYRPELAMSGGLQTRPYTGYLHALHERLDREAKRRRERLWALVGRGVPREIA